MNELLQVIKDEADQWIEAGAKGLAAIAQAYTTGRRVFAEGLKPSAKALQPSAKDLPRAALGEEPSGKKTSAKESLPRAFYRALGKVFAEG